MSESEVDWLVDVAPEIFDDSSCFFELLSDRSSLSAVERLVVADGMIRIAVVHGHLDDGIASTFVQLALSQLINSFFLIIGPSGVPLSTLATEANGTDTAKFSRKAAFRILKMLQKVRLYQTAVRHECIMFLQKFVGLCKGEILIGSLPSAIANRQKGLLKELLDAAMKASDAMGYVIQSG